MRRIVLLLVGLALFAVGCGSSGAPSSYEESVEDFYLRGCRVALDNPNFNNAEAVCQCSYERMTVEIPFEDFAALNDRLREDVSLLENPQADSLAPQALQIVSDCIKSVPLSS